MPADCFLQDIFRRNNWELLDCFNLLPVPLACIGNNGDRMGWSSQKMASPTCLIFSGGYGSGWTALGNQYDIALN